MVRLLPQRARAAPLVASIAGVLVWQSRPLRPLFVGGSCRRTSGLQGASASSSSRAGSGRHFASGARAQPQQQPETVLNLDQETVDLHRLYHDRTIEYTMDNMDWVQSKSYGTDGALSAAERERVRRRARARFFRWPELDPRDVHDASFAEQPQRFCKVGSRAEKSDPADNVFVISLCRRPSKLKHVLSELHQEGVSARIVDAVDGDAVLCKDDVDTVDVKPVPGYAGHRNHKIHLSSGEVGCFMSHYTIWQHMVKHGIEVALILEDDFDFQPDFKQRLGACLEEAADEDWNLLYVGRSPVEADLRRVSSRVVEPGYTLWTVGYIIKLEAAKQFVEQRVHRCFLPLDEYFSLAMGRYTTVYNEFAVEWGSHVPRVLRPLALTPPLVMPYVGSMFESDTAMMRKGTRYIKDLPQSVSDEEVEQEMLSD
eukprot:TRINITY_DN6869_c0_g2_i1.p1 TRINITY_DN6869_c0_g2~~TRINITY_DN6869_c0_g2_i1.p1  ORF type:complete len:427 (+),score=85.57 TRINITY_DN6869_c0_g2_i1:132-1412(+)